MITSNNTVLRIIAGRTDEPMWASLACESEISSVSYRVTDMEGAVCAEGRADVNGKCAELSALFAAEAWSAQRPYLYTLSVKVAYKSGEGEEISDKFGYRYFSTDENNIYLNGYPFYMRAYIRGCAAHEHQNNCGLSEYDFYKKNILAARSYGFNAVRFHSVIPPEECFRAADDLGMLIHIEMRKDREDYNNLEEMLYGKSDFVSDEELLGIINSLYNHPSFMVYCVGNEIRHPGTDPRIREIRDFIKREDPTRLFIDTCAHGEYDRDYVDFDVQHMGYFFPFGKNRNMFADTDNLLCFGTVRDIDMVKEAEGGSKIRRAIAFDRPLIAHEVCHYTSWRDFYALKEKFKKYGRPAPWWVDEEIKMIEAKGYAENYKESLGITKDFQFRCWKTAIEAIRTSPLLRGFHMLQFADTDKYENSNGVVDCFDDPHGISPEQFRKFNADTVLLAKLPERVYTFGERVKIPVLLSQYMIAPPAVADFTYLIKDGERIIQKGTLAGVDTAGSGLYEICSLDLTIPTLDAPTKLTLDLSLAFSDGSESTNSWEIWAFHAVADRISLDAASDMKEGYLDRTFEFNADSPLTVTDKLDGKLFERLEAGEDVLLIYRTDWTRHLLHKGMEAPEYSFRHTWERYKGVIWDRGTINGGPDDKATLNRHGFVTDGQINYQYYTLIDDSDKINLDSFPAEVHSIVSGLDKCNRDRFDPKKFELPELMYDRTMRRFSYAFSLRVGKGRLLVSGFNFTSINDKDPAAVAMLRALVSYAREDERFGSTAPISADALREYLSSVAKAGPQKERMMTQYWQLDDEPVESMAYWRESERYLREDL